MNYNQKSILLLIAFLALSSFLLSIISAANFLCWIQQGTNPGSAAANCNAAYANTGQVIMYTSNVTNAHSALASQGGYSNVLCCNFGGGSTACSSTTDPLTGQDANKILGLAYSTNSHAESGGLTLSYAHYNSNNVCYDSVNSCEQVPVNYNCGNNWTDVISLSSGPSMNYTNSHVEDVGYSNYGTKICCNVTVTPQYPKNCQITSALWNTTLAYKGNNVDLDVATQNCLGQQISFSVKKTDGTSAVNNPNSVNIDSNGNAVGTWNAENASNYIFNATVIGTSISNISSNILNVQNPPDWCTTPPPGVVKCSDYLTEANCSLDPCGVGNSTISVDNPNPPCGSGAVCSCFWNTSETINQCEGSVKYKSGDTPDLISQIDSFSCPLVGQSVNFQGTIENIGQGTADPSTAGFTMDGNSIGTQSVLTLTSGSSSSVTSDNWTVTDGQHNLGLCADITGVISESNENNNCANNSFFSGPNICLAVSLTTSVNGGVAPLNGVGLTAQVSGQGGLGTINYSFYCDKTETTPDAISTTTENKVDEAGLCNYANPGVYNATVIVTANGMTASATVPITVNGPTGGTPDLISDIGTPLTLVIGNNASFPGIIKNIGQGTADPSTAGFTMDGNSIGTQSVPTLTSGSSSSVTSDNWTVTDGQHNLGLCADITGVISESNENNNCANSSFSVKIGGDYLFVNLNSNVNGGVAPLNGVSLSAQVSGQGLGTINYSFYCDSTETTPDVTYTDTATTKTADGLCNYTNPGVYNANVTVTTNGMTASATVPITVTVSNNKGNQKIGTCYYHATSSTTCQNNQLITVSLSARWEWADAGVAPLAGGCTNGYVLSGGMCHYDPQNLAASCTDQTESLHCPTQIPLPFFTFYNLVAALLIVAVIYIIIGMRKKKVRIKLV